MALPEAQALNDLIERTQATLTDPAERDRALADLEASLQQMLGAVSTYRGDAQAQLRGNGGSRE